MTPRQWRRVERDRIVRIKSGWWIVLLLRASSQARRMVVDPWPTLREARAWLRAHPFE